MPTESLLSRIAQRLGAIFWCPFFRTHLTGYEPGEAWLAGLDMEVKGQTWAYYFSCGQGRGIVATAALNLVCKAASQKTGDEGVEGMY